MDGERFEPASGRLFIAVEAPDFVKQAIARIQADEGRFKGLSWIPPEKLHLTLAYLGEVSPERQEVLAARLPEARVKPFFLALEGMGVFPGKGPPRVLWAGFAPVDPRLFQLHAKIERILLDLGFEPDRRRYHPHLTLARCTARGAGAADQLVKRQKTFGTAPFRVDGITLYSSQLSSRGSIYSRLLRVPFESPRES